MDIYCEEKRLKRMMCRQTTVREKVNAYYSFLKSFRLGDSSISEKMKNAVNYSMNQKKYLCWFLKRGDVPIDNGFSGHLAKSFAIARGNWMLCTSPKRGLGIHHHEHDRGDREIEWSGCLLLSQVLAGESAIHTGFESWQKVP